MKKATVTKKDSETGSEYVNRLIRAVPVKEHITPREKFDAEFNRKNTILMPKRKLINSCVRAIGTVRALNDSSLKCPIMYEFVDKESGVLSMIYEDRRRVYDGSYTENNELIRNTYYHKDLFNRQFSFVPDTYVEKDSYHAIASLSNTIQGRYVVTLTVELDKAPSLFTMLTP